MSVPLPIYHQYTKHNYTTAKTPPPPGPAEKIHVHDLFLTPDERFEIFQVKAAERPHLLHYNPQQDDDDDDEDSVALHVRSRVPLEELDNHIICHPKVCNELFQDK
mmetsp:Transcript_14615/g.27483  ORF Transcript_14615/g.27483 Transcript_14615/m.27483 type:complete len:106 (-) Transcript_14615:621-938(-)